MEMKKILNSVLKDVLNVSTDHFERGFYVRPNSGTVTRLFLPRFAFLIGWIIDLLFFLEEKGIYGYNESVRLMVIAAWKADNL